MTRIRIHMLASELGVGTQVILQLLEEQGEFVTSSSSTITAPIAQKIRQSISNQSLAGSVVSVQPDTPPSNSRGNLSGKSPTGTTRPSSRQFGWRAGAVRPPQHPDLLANINAVAGKFPILHDHIEALQAVGSQVVFAKLIHTDFREEFAVVHVRFSGAIEAGFGFTREVMLFYSPHRDLQVRTFQKAVAELASNKRSVTPDIFFIWAPDDRLRLKLNDWSQPSKLAIPLMIDETDELSLITLLRDYIYARDLFYVTTPVSGASFFGRRTILQSLRDDVFNQHVTGVFGLRKSGKTSILTQLMEDLKGDNVVTVLMDLEAFPSPPEDPTDDILADLRRRLIAELGARNLRTKELAELAARPSILDLKNALQSVLKRLNRDGQRVLLLLDEIEYLTPADRIDIAEGDMPRIAQMLAALRSIVQETENFTFMLSGLTSAIVEGGRLYGRPNPLFSWAKAIYVKPLEREEADDLASTVGGKMGIKIEKGALEALHQASGGHAFLYRNLSSAVVQHLPKDVFQRNMTRSDVLGELDDWKSRVQGNIDEMFQHVKRYYPDEAFMLELLMDSPDEFLDLAPTEFVAVRRLSDLGLIQKVNGEFQPNVILELR